MYEASDTEYCVVQRISNLKQKHDVITRISRNDIVEVNGQDVSDVSNIDVKVGDTVKLMENKTSKRHILWKAVVLPESALSSSSRTDSQWRESSHDGSDAAACVEKSAKKRKVTNVSGHEEILPSAEILAIVGTEQQSSKSPVLDDYATKSDLHQIKEELHVIFKEELHNMKSSLVDDMNLACSRLLHNSIPTVTDPPSSHIDVLSVDEVESVLSEITAACDQRSCSSITNPLEKSLIQLLPQTDPNASGDLTSSFVKLPLSNSSDCSMATSSLQSAFSNYQGHYHTNAHQMPTMPANLPKTTNLVPSKEKAKVIHWVEHGFSQKLSAEQVVEKFGLSSPMGWSDLLKFGLLLARHTAFGERTLSVCTVRGRTRQILDPIRMNMLKEILRGHPIEKNDTIFEHHWSKLQDNIAHLCKRLRKDLEKWGLLERAEVLFKRDNN